MNPEDLLAEIRELLAEYLALGEDTPVSAEAQALMSAIDAGGGMAPAEGAPPDAMDALGAQNPEGMPPPDMGGGLAELGGMMPPMDAGPPPEAPEGYSGKDMGEARSAAKEFLKKKKTKA